MTQDVAKALAAKDFAKAGKSLKQLADAAAKGELSPEQKEKLEKELKEIANTLKDDKQLSEALDALSKSLSDSDMAGLEKAIGDATSDMDKLAEMEYRDSKMLQAASGMLEDRKDETRRGDGRMRGERLRPLRTWSGANPYRPGDGFRRGRPGDWRAGPRHRRHRAGEARRREFRSHPRQGPNATRPRGRRLLRERERPLRARPGRNISRP